MTDERPPLIAPGAVLKILFFCIGVLVVGDIARQIALFGFKTTWPYELSQLLNIGGEFNLPSWYSSVQLAFAGIFALLIFHDRRSESERFVFFWALLGLAMLYISLDEAVGLHERVSRPLREMYGIGGVFFYAWLIPGIVVTAVFVVSSIPFLLALPRRTARLMVLSGILFVGGAVGLEMFEGVLADQQAIHTLFFGLIVTAEEALEMVGIAVFIYTLCDFAATRCDRLSRLFR